VKNFLFIVILSIMPSALFGADRPVDRPYWSLELKGGRFQPDIDNWEDYYGNKYAGEFGGALAYKVIRQLELGIEGTFTRDTGQGYAPINSAASGTTILAGRVIYELAPLNVFVLARGIFSEDQWVVPYVGGGWTRMFYREEIQFQGIIRGYADGYHARGGLQFSLDVLDPDAANNLNRDYGIHHTYLFIEGEYTRAMVDTVPTSSTPSQSINLGGLSWRGGLLFEF
jgi:hypothetical protein